MTAPFDEATSVRRVSDTTYSAEVHDGWDIGGHANGGYMLALAGRAMADASGRPPLSITAHYLRPAPAGPCEIDVSIVRAGRRLATAIAVLTMDGKPVLQLAGTFGEQAPGGPSAALDEPVDLPPYDVCATAPDPADGPGPAIMERLAIRLRPERRRLPRRQAERPRRDVRVVRVRRRTTDRRHRAAARRDAFPPAVFNTELPVGWVPTVELTVHVRGTPAPGPLRCAFRSRFIQDGLLDEEGEMWDSAGALVAQSRQLALVPR